MCVEDQRVAVDEEARTLCDSDAFDRAAEAMRDHSVRDIAPGLGNTRVLCLIQGPQELLRRLRPVPSIFAPETPVRVLAQDTASFAVLHVHYAFERCCRFCAT